MAENEMNHRPEVMNNLVDVIPAASHDPSVVSLHCPSPLNVASTWNMFEAQWNDIFEGDNGVAMGNFRLSGRLLVQTASASCSKFNIKGVRNGKKPETVPRISNTHTNQKACG